MRGIHAAKLHISPAGCRRAGRSRRSCRQYRRGINQISSTFPESPFGGSLFSRRKNLFLDEQNFSANLKHFGELRFKLKDLKALDSGRISPRAEKFRGFLRSPKKGCLQTFEDLPQKTVKVSALPKCHESRPILPRLQVL